MFFLPVNLDLDPNIIIKVKRRSTLTLIVIDNTIIKA